MIMMRDEFREAQAINLYFDEIIPFESLFRFHIPVHTGTIYKRKFYMKTLPKAAAFFSCVAGNGVDQILR